MKPAPLILAFAICLGSTAPAFTQAENSTLFPLGASGAWTLETRQESRDLAKAAGCVQGADPHVLCLGGGRFELKAGYRIQDSDPITLGTAVRLTDDSGYFWFFSATNIEVVGKVLNACADPSHSYWVFWSGLTRTGVSATAFDTRTGKLRVYATNIGERFPMIDDTDGFKTCS